jgi:Asp-tRNA(Asn)/Glu-tRNA(Gln) amidotransferase A subunit family amidase
MNHGDPLARSMDTVGPLGADVAAVELGMRLIEPGFAAGSFEPGVGRVRPETDPEVDPAVDAAIDAALGAAGVTTVPGGPAGLPASLQLIGPPGGEEQLIALGRTIEAALAAC